MNQRHLFLLIVFSTGNEKRGQVPVEFRHNWGYGTSPDRHWYRIRGVSE